jgi:hypothetical protein
LLDNEDPWVRALARLHLGKMRNMLGQGGRDADAYLEMALAEFRALGERFGISFALTELADRIAMRGESASLCSKEPGSSSGWPAAGCTTCRWYRRRWARMGRTAGRADSWSWSRPGACGTGGPATSSST